MSKSIYEQIMAGAVEVNHQATGYSKQTAMFNLPAFLQIPEATLFDKASLLEWLEEHGCLLEVLHSGVQQEVIGVRATARPSVTKADPNPSLDAPERHRLVRDYKPRQIPRLVSDEEKTGKAFGKLSREQQLKILKDAGFEM